MPSVADDLITGVVATIAELNLTGTYAGNIGSNVYDQTQLETTNVSYPCVVVWCQDDADEDLTSETNLVTYQIAVAILDRDSKRDHRIKADYLAWRRAILNKFRSLVTIDGVSECYDVRTRGGATIDKNSPAFEQVVSSLTVLCRTNETRVAS